MFKARFKVLPYDLASACYVMLEGKGISMVIVLVLQNLRLKFDPHNGGLILTR